MSSDPDRDIGFVCFVCFVVGSVVGKSKTDRHSGSHHRCFGTATLDITARKIAGTEEAADGDGIDRGLTIRAKGAPELGCRRGPVDEKVLTSKVFHFDVESS